ncbi:RidA family protein [Alkanindiges sp. WGS2144]|uniref:RidA family protein n=1 Tax=Alkanindiges sp. WGS2144 TaxID=3366808 RepID=UPI0037528E54
MSDIKRLHMNNCYSEATIYKGVVFLAGQVPRQTSGEQQGDIITQAQEVFAQIDSLLAEAGSDKHRILSSQIFLADMADYEGFNQAWREWVSLQNSPPRVTVQARLANPAWKLEMVITAAAY